MLVANEIKVDAGLLPDNQRREQRGWISDHRVGDPDAMRSRVSAELLREHDVMLEFFTRRCSDGVYGCLRQTELLQCSCW